MNANEQIRRLRDALVVAVEALEESNGSSDSETLEWLRAQVDELVVAPLAAE